MRGSISITRAMFLPTACAVTLLCAPAVHAFPGCSNPVGPDVIVGDIQSIFNPTGTDSVNHIDVFSFGTYSCNLGNQNVVWQSNTNLHPVVSQNLFKMKTTGSVTTFEQMGQSWLKHTFLALTDNICCTCNGQGGAVLGVGCADPYTASRNAVQSGGTGGCGPKWQVNASNGVYTFPQANPPGTTTFTFRRLQCPTAQLEPSSASVRYFAECQYVTQDDAAAGNKNNNASNREVSMTGSGDAYSASGFIGATTRKLPAITRWKLADPTVTESQVNIAGDGRIYVCSKATSLGGGQWHYEYAVHNLNSDRSVGTFTVPLPSDANLSVNTIGFHDVNYHDGDGESSVNRDGTDWPGIVAAGQVQWATTPFASNANANAIRWATCYNFRFNSNKPPKSGNITVGTYKSPASFLAAAQIPAEDCNGNGIWDATDIANMTSPDVNLNGIPDECENLAPPCAAGDFNNTHTIDIDDLLAVINAWGACGGACPPYCIGDATHNCLIDIDDMLFVINAWGPCN